VLDDTDGTEIVGDEFMGVVRGGNMLIQESLTDLQKLAEDEKCKQMVANTLCELSYFDGFLI